MHADAGTSRLRPWHLTLIHPSPPPYLTSLTGTRLLYVPTRSFGALFTHPQTLEPSSPAPSWLSHVEPSRPSRLESRLCRCLSSLGTEGLIALWYREVSCSHALLPLSITATWNSRCRVPTLKANSCRPFIQAFDWCPAISWAPSGHGPSHSRYLMSLICHQVSALLRCLDPKQPEMRAVTTPPSRIPGCR